ncbi:MAG TPA: metallophosphoesterase [Candidatus Norongarragalinales archaeon]|jgi:DNA repair exonuclease SbcCD nuclease subunit|nr:metallophosphoesterase [Candidatus Norongarragalinales archaeon]
MKIAIASDFHLGYNDDALPQAREALSKAARDCDVMLLPGDLFDIRVPRQETVHEAIQLFNYARGLMREKTNDLAMTRVNSDGSVTTLETNPLLVTYGTHERRSKGMTNIVQVLDAAGVFVNIHASHVVVEKNGEKVAVYGMGGVPEEFATQAVKALEPKPLPGCFSIFAFHQSLKELIPVDDCLAISDLPEGFDLYVNGHIHWRRDINSGGKRVLIPGSTVITQMKEIEQERKGFWIFDTNTRKAEFNEIDSRPFYYIDIELDQANATDVLAKAREKLAEVASKKDAKKPLVKIKLRGTLSKGTRSSHIDVSKLREEFSDKLLASIDKEFESDELKEQIEKVRRQREESRSSRELGLDILKTKLKAANLDINAEQIFDLLAEGEIEQAMKALDAKASPHQ